MPTRPTEAIKPSCVLNMPTRNWKLPNELFTNGDADQGQANIQEVVKLTARKAADAAASSGKH